MYRSDDVMHAAQTPTPYRPHDNYRPPFTVLLVEDNPDDEILTIRALRLTGLPILLKVAHDGVEAIRYLVDDGNGADELPQVVLLDLKLPKISGLDVLARVRSVEAIKTIPIVCMTSSDEESDLVAAHSRGANAFIRKPSDYRRYLDVVSMTARWWLEMNPLPQQSAAFRAASFRSIYEHDQTPGQ